MPQLDPNGPDLTVAEAATEMRMSPRTVYRYLAKGLLPGSWHTEKAWRIPPQSVIDYIAATTIPH